MAGGQTEHDATAQSTPLLRVGFFMSLALGHRSYYLNWRRVVDSMPEAISAAWVPIESGVHPNWGKVPLLTEGLRRTLSEWHAMHAGFKQGPFDAVLVNPHGMALKHQSALARQPHFLSLDSTRKQFNAFHRWYRPAPTEEGLMGSLRMLRQRRAYRNAAGVFPASKWAASSLVEDYGVDAAKIHVVPFSVDTDLWRPAATPPAADGIVRMLFVGGAFERKGGDLLLRWARQTSRRSWELHIVTTQAREAPDRVFFHQASNNSAQLIALAQRCNLFVLPTRADCSSIAAMEAMSTGLPTLLTRVGGVTELVAEDETGCTVEPDDYDALHAKVETMLEDPARLVAMGLAARARAVDKFNIQTNVRRALSVIRSVVRG